MAELAAIGLMNANGYKYDAFRVFGTAPRKNIGVVHPSSLKMALTAPHAS
jgi:hypothetical protein